MFSGIVASVEGGCGCSNSTDEVAFAVGMV